MASSQSENKENNGNINIADLLSNLNLFGNNNNDSGSNGNNDFDFSSLDPDMLQMLMKAFTAFNSVKGKDDPRSNLLYAIKPHLHGKRSNEVENCVKILKMSSIFGAINKKE